MSADSGRLLRIERTFDAPIEDVFDAWTSEEVLRRWLHAGRYRETPIAEVDLRVGGRIRIVMRDSEDGADFEAVGEYTRIERPHRLAFTLTFEDDPSNVQMIELEFSEHDGSTTVVMVNRDISTRERRDAQHAGWGICLDNLERALAA